MFKILVRRLTAIPAANKKRNVFLRESPYNNLLRLSDGSRCTDSPTDRTIFNLKLDGGKFKRSLSLACFGGTGSPFALERVNLITADHHFADDCLDNIYSYRVT